MYEVETNLSIIKAISAVVPASVSGDHRADPEDLQFLMMDIAERAEQVEDQINAERAESIRLAIRAVT